MSINGDVATPTSYEINGVSTDFNDAGPTVVPDSEADAYTVPGQYYSFFVDGGNGYGTSQ